MKLRYFIALFFVSLVNEAQGTGLIAKLTSAKDGCFESMVFTPTNLTLKFKPPGGFFDISQAEKLTETMCDVEYVLSFDKETVFADMYHVKVSFTPISLKNNQKGFRISDSFLWFHEETIKTVYLVLDDAPVEVDEDDVEMIMDDGEWKPYAKSPPVIQTEETQPTPKDDSAIAKDVDDESPPNPKPPTPVIANVSAKVVIASEAK